MNHDLFRLLRQACLLATLSALLVGHADTIRRTNVIRLGSYRPHSIRMQRHRVLELAATIEPDPARLMSWFHHESIYALGDRTAEKVLHAGDGDALADYLMSIVRDTG